MFSKREAISFGWKTTKANLWMLALVFLTVGFLPSVVLLISGGFLNSSLGSLLSWSLSMLLSIGLIKILLSLVDTGKAHYDDLFTNYKLFLKFTFTTIIMIIVVGLGMLLLIIPGIILALRLQFATYFVVDKDSGPFEALQKSWNLTRGSTWNLFLLGLLFLGINILGFLALIIGLLVTVPTTSLARAYVYRKLASQVTS